MKEYSSIIRSVISAVFKFIVDLINNPITISIAFALWAIPVYFFLSQHLSGIKNTTDYENVKQFIEWFGVPYGLLLALVLVNVWTQFDTTNRAFDREADAVSAFYDTSLLISNREVRKQLHKSIREYVEHVNACYFKEYMIGEIKTSGDAYLNKIRKLTGRLIKGKENDVLTGELLQLINELTDDRGDRLSYSKQRMPKPVLILAFVASFLWLTPFFILGFTNTLAGIVFIGGVSFIVVSILLIVNDLDNPFTGTWCINLDSWNELLIKLKNGHSGRRQQNETI
jgi:hypothetical protein